LEEIRDKSIIETIHDVCERTTENETETESLNAVLSRLPGKDSDEKKCAGNEHYLEERRESDPERHTGIFSRREADKFSKQRNTCGEKCFRKHSPCKREKECYGSCSN